MIWRVTLIALCLTGAAHATPGRTDGKGCHQSKKAGYHCHGAKTITKVPVKKGLPHEIPKVNKAIPGRKDQPK